MDDHWNASVYRQNTGFVSNLGATLVEWLAATPGERIMDLGCGDGELSLKLAALGCDVVGVDLSANMVEAARQKGLDARICDAASLDFDAEFEAVFSNAALHWMSPLRPVFSGVWTALVPGGRFVAETGPEGNVTLIRHALRQALESRGFTSEEVEHSIDPWSFSSREEYESLLVERGFTVERIEQFDRPTPLPTGISGWIDSVARPFLNVLPEAQREAYVTDVESQLRPSLFKEGQWYADYVRLRFIARKP